MVAPTSKPVVVYGVSGYTGRLICEYLREPTVPFLAAGCEGKKVQEVVDRIPALDQAYAAYSLLQQPPRRSGFASACQAFGHRELLGVLRNFGLVFNPLVEVHS
ncbi:MAG: DUF5938 domain-containing protein [Pseudonocardia sp.]|nr:DUF5938 domain-containing protein [Pseudonocardia sp.]